MQADINNGWLPLLSVDLDAVNALADRIHTTLPERPEVFEEKVKLFPNGCRKLVLNCRIVGYGISHPWMLNSIPPLDEFLKALPKNPECVYLHDIVVAPEARGLGAASRYVDYLKQLAYDINIMSLALVSVYGTDVLWSRFGFRTVLNSDLSFKLVSYGATAKYMICDLK
ncbi:MAG: GNAT family N-acetyltransferase [Terracidiphilus sp.]|jgi:GNAT superfamily N-acetyltransferase